MAEKYFEGIGRRKTSVARVRIQSGDVVSTVNGKPIDEYFTRADDSKNALAPLQAVGLADKYYITASVAGGGVTGHVDAVQLGLARALYLMQPELKGELRKQGFVTRDPRMVERKKYNRVKARKKPQFSKR